MRRPNTIRDFWEKVDKSGDCWQWLGSFTPQGYGQIRIDGKSWSTHRLSFVVVKGEIPEGLHLDHLCRNTRCCNPDHLEPVTPKENVLRGEGLSAKFARATHCIHGHPFDKANTFIYKRPKTVERRCIACNRQNTRERRARLKAMAVT